MRKIRIAFLLILTFLAQSVFADQDALPSSDSKSCGMVAHSCIKAGYGKTKTKGQYFWQDCMKPVLLGKAVKGVTIDTDVVKACRDDKISKLQDELAALKEAAAQ